MVLTCLVVVLGVPAFQQVTQAKSPATLLSQKNINATTDTLLEQGKQRYESGQLVEAVQIWKQAIATATQMGLRQQAVVQYYLAVAYQDLGQWQAAERAIAQAFDFLSSVDDPLLYAQLLNTQGSYQFRTGQTETALETWKQAEQRYRKLGDVRGIALSQINQTQALQVLGYYRQARRTLEQLRRDLASLPDSLLKAKALQSLGVTLQVVGDLEQSRVVLSKSLVIAQRLKGQPEEAPAAALSKLNATSAIAETLLQLGNTANAQRDIVTALTLYQQARATAPRSQTWLEASLNQLKLLITDGRFAPAIALMPEIEGYLERLSASRAGVYAQVNFAETMMLGVRDQSLLKKNGQIVNLAQLLARAVQQARSLKDARAEAYALGQLGHLYEQNQQWADALNLTRQALQIGQQIQADDLAATWQWQQGRILKAQGEFEGAITAYNQSITLLQSLRKDLVATPDVQFSFREQVEPVYRQLVQLLLRDVDRLPTQMQQPRLQRSREVIEALQLAELENFFREACLTYEPRSIDKIDPQAAVIYPILSGERLEVILSLPNQPLQHYGTDLPNDAGRTAFRDLRQALIPAFPPSQVLPPAQQFYNWLIRPAVAALTQHQIKQLVFVLDGYLRSLPMAVLHDGNQYLIEKYSLALTPGLQLLNRMRSPQQFRVLAGGITEARQGFPALPAVESEIAQIKAQLPTRALLNRNFTDAKLQHEVTGIPFSIVHLATHGQFSSRAEDTFVLTWNDRLKVKDLEQLLQQRELSTPLELLVLSACQTAKGNDRAALGIAGVAVRSGARSTIATLWSVQDQSTAELMATFYQKLTQPNTSRAEALRQAQLSLLRNSQYQHPYYWSPFVLLGNWL